MLTSLQIHHPGINRSKNNPQYPTRKSDIYFPVNKTKMQYHKGFAAIIAGQVPRQKTLWQI